MVAIWEKSRSSLNEHLAFSTVSKTKNGSNKKTSESNSNHRSRTRTSTPPSCTKRTASLRSLTQRSTRTSRHSHNPSIQRRTSRNSPILEHLLLQQQRTSSNQHQ